MSATPESFVITNARIVDPAKDGVEIGSIVIENGKIGGTRSGESFDAKGTTLAPGIVDLGAFAVDKAACRFGGITRVALMPDQERVLDDPGLIERAAKAAKPDLWVHPLVAATRGLAGSELAEMGLAQRTGARAVATGRARIADAGVMLAVLRYAKALGLTVIAHAEDEGLTRGAAATAGETATRLGLPNAPSSAEAMAVARDIALVEESGAALHFRQITTAYGLDLVRNAKRAGLPVTCGITPAHLFLSETGIGEFRTFARLSPPLRSEDDRKACLAAIADGTIDVIASGHDPRGAEDKRLPYADAEPGMAGAATLLALSLGLVRDGLVTLNRLFALLSANPARVLGVNAGSMANGAEADLILIDTDTPWQIDAAKMSGSAGNTPFDGLPVQGKVRAMWKGGRPVH